MFLSYIFPFSILSKYFLFIFAASLLYGFSSVIDKIVLGVLKPLQYILIAHIFIAFNFSVMLISRGGFNANKLFHDLTSNAKWFLAASILTIAYRILQAIAVSMAYVSVVIPMRHLSVLFSTVIGGKFFGEKHMIHRTISALIMLAGTWMLIA